MFERRQIYCHIRFSFYGVTDTRLKPDEQGLAHAILYDETRMARRFFLFENLTLPSLRAQLDRDFKVIIMTSSVMPEPFKERLRAITKNDPNVTIDFSTETHGEAAFLDHMIGSFGPQMRDISVHFRLDDDDAIAHTYIAQLRAISQSLPPSTHITFPTGITLFPKTPESQEGACMVHQHLLITPGLAIICNEHFRKNPFMMMHGNVWRRWPVVSYPGLTAYIRTHHQSNDTVDRQDKVLQDIRATRFGPSSATIEADTDAALAQNFSFIDQARLCDLISDCAAITSLVDLPSV